MLVKQNLYALLQADEQRILRIHIERAIKIKLGFSGLQEDVSGQVWMPACHEVSHAYAKAFNVTCVDGEKIFVKERTDRRFRSGIVVDTTTYTHSWNLITLSDEMKVILDLIPDESCSLLPILVQCPNPTYWEPLDRRPQRVISEYIAEPLQAARITRLAAEFQRIDRGS